ncbi:MAG TPA: hypothetical protein VJH92_06405 [Candidatus Nanoarchaeia archaeon]|nr:hypothetical protein [Candidatus Nanoarchaeia archaeon]
MTNGALAALILLQTIRRQEDEGGSLDWESFRYDSRKLKQKNSGRDRKRILPYIIAGAVTLAGLAGIVTNRYSIENKDPIARVTYNPSKDGTGIVVYDGKTNSPEQSLNRQ